MPVQNDGRTEGIDAVMITGGSAAGELNLHRQSQSEPGRDGRKEVVQYRRLREVNRARHTAELHSPLGVARLRFAEGLAEMMHEAARKYVEVKGLGDTAPAGRTKEIEVSSIADLGLELSPAEKRLRMEDEIARAAQFNPLEFERSELLDDELVDEWLDAILNRKYKAPC